MNWDNRCVACKQPYYPSHDIQTKKCLFGPGRLTVTPTAFAQRRGSFGDLVVPYRCPVCNFDTHVRGESLRCDSCHATFKL